MHFFANRQVLKDGGSAVDAAIATLLCNGAVHSYSMGLGGGFVMVIYKKDQNKSYVLNAREVAPLKATYNMFVNSNLSSLAGNYIIKISFLSRFYQRLFRWRGSGGTWRA